MARRGKRPPLPPPVPASPGTASGVAENGIDLSRVLAGGLALLLAAAALWLPARTLAEIRAQLLLRTAQVERKQARESARPETNLRRAYRYNPDEPEVVFDLASFLVAREKRNFSSGQYNLIKPANFHEALELLDRSEAILPFRPAVARLRGEAEWMLAVTYERAGDRQRAADAQRRACEDLTLAARLLPRPRDHAEDFNLALMQTAAGQGHADLALGTLHTIERLGQRGYMYDIDLGYDEQAAQIWRSAGLLPQQARELRYRLERKPADPALLQLAAQYANEPQMALVVRETLASLQRRGKLDARGTDLLSTLSQPSNPPA